MLPRRASRGLVVAAVAALAIVLEVHPARSDCSNPGGSEGFDQCQQYPGCQCVSKIVTCPNGGWYTQYSVVQPCGPKPPPTPVPPSASAPPPLTIADPPTTPCGQMKKYLADQQRLLGGFEDPSLVGQAMAWHESVGQYQQEVWWSTHPDALMDPYEVTDLKLMSTDPRTCVVDPAQGCTILKTKFHLPQAACQIALDHEQVHHQQCEAGQQHYQLFNRYDLEALRQREIQAYQQSNAEIAQWLQDNCP